MKQIYMTLALVGSMITGSHAQADFGIEILAPISEESFSNDVDTIKFSFQIKNNSALSLNAATDTIYLVYDLRMFSLELPDQDYVLEKYAITLGPEESWPYNIKAAIGTQYWYDETAPKVAVPADSKVCPYVGFWITHTNDDGTYYVNDPGVNTDVISDAYGMTSSTPNDFYAAIIAGLSGNNFSKVNNVKFGTGITDKCDNSTSIIGMEDQAKVSLTTYPNPAYDNININFLLDKTSNATVRVSDITGRTMISKELGKVFEGEHKISIDILSLNAGMYLIELNADQQKALSKLTVQK